MLRRYAKGIPPRNKAGKQGWQEEESSTDERLKRAVAAGLRGNKKSLTAKTIRLSYYVNGLVSTGKTNSLHNIKKNFITKEKKCKEFYSQH
ncbi:hypothetical protein DCC81_03080 [Chitinophaga parva]|uniref:Uncharacterized protein n=1 Tax=Chitinophaga parva TaxID=2169414 RepID=A0A2T7BLD3_9BACT|nr:hypothetical protein [Chitinophaga parva]PUZ28483.1 hypothetical protein DCC81_03080 [Chitinophaga parva]